MARISADFSVKVIDFFKAKDRESIVEQITGWSPKMWHAARFTVQAHGISPLIYKIFEYHQVLEDLDQSFRSYITDQYLQNRLRIIRIQEILQTLLSQANLHNIPVMPLKGSILINSYYQDPAIRPMADIDLLIYPQDYDRLGQLLQEMEYHLLANDDHKVYTNVFKTVSLEGEHPDNPIKIEVHHATRWPIGHLKFDITDMIWKNSKNGFLGFESAFAPAKERLLLMLICHNAGNQFNGKMRVFHLNDISLVIRHMDHQQWSNLRQIVKDYKLERVMFSALTIAKRFSDIDLPDGLIEKYKWNTPPKLQYHVKSQSLDSLIATNDYKLLTLKLNERSSIVNRNTLKIYQLYFIAIVQSMQLKWFFPGKEKILQVQHALSLSSYKKDQGGNIIAYIIYYWILIPIIRLQILFIGNRQRDKLLGSLRLRLIRYLYETK